MGRKPCCDKVGLKRGPWSVDEDRKLTAFVLGNGIHCWRTVPKLAGLLRCGKSCRLRWINYLRPDLKRGGFTEAEEDEIIQLHRTLGNRWSKIASHFAGRTDNEIKNHWNTKIKKRRLKEMGADPNSPASVVEPKDAIIDKGLSPVPKGDEVPDEGVTKNNSLGQEYDDNDDLLSNYEIFNGRLEVIEHWLNEDDDSAACLDGKSSSASRPESLNSSLSDELSLEKQSSGSIILNDQAYLHQWFDEMDSFFGLSYHPN